MATRRIGTGVGTYLRADGVWHFGSLGEQVDVHEDDLERFDRLNTPVAPPVAVIVAPETLVEAVNDDLSEIVVDEQFAKPARMGSKASWVEYAVAQGMSQEEAEADTRDGLVEKFGG